MSLNKRVDKVTRDNEGAVVWYRIKQASKTNGSAISLKIPYITTDKY